MAGIIAMGDLSHELETLVIQIDNGTVAVNDRAHHVMQSSLDELAHDARYGQRRKLPTMATALIAQIRGLSERPRSQRGTLVESSSAGRRNPLLRR